ncbi:hypothetical protein NECID01_1813 [Nematocida sp. AWRm77]|nr:hypothetical protein NECID01_1813 [Nematocida sp. AWRm77]
MPALLPKASFLFTSSLFCTAFVLLVFSSSDEYYVLPMDKPELQNGCMEIKDTAHVRLPASEKWMGLVTKDGCSISTKHRNLAKMGASGMIISAAVSSEPFSPDRSSFYIVPVASSFYNMFAKETNARANSTLAPIKIVLPIRKPFPVLQISYIIFLILMIFVFPMMFERLDERVPSKTLGPKELATLQCAEFGALEEKHRKYEECPICFDRLVPVSPVRVLHCCHYFHVDCIDPWLLGRSVRCPVCNYELQFV